MNAGQWRVATTLAWRTARRGAVRSLLVGAMIGLPVALVVAGSSIARTAVPNPEEEVAGMMGAADVLVSPGRVLTRDVLEERLPRGSQFIVLYRDEVSLVRKGELLEISLVHSDRGLQSPLLDGLLELEAGRAPSREGELALHPRALELLGSETGRRVTISGETYLVSGVVRQSQDFGSLVGIVGPSTLPQSAPASEVLIDLPLDHEGSQLPREITRHAENVIARDDALAVNEERSLLSDTLALAAGILALCSVGLVAAAAFIVGARRQLRGLGILLAAGGEPRHARAVVLLTGTTLGLIGTSVGIAFGVTAARAVYPFLAGWTGRSVGAFEVSPLVLLGSFVMGLAAATLAAYAPARMAGKLTVTDALASRTPPPRPPGNLARLGVVLFGAGAAATTWSMSQRQAMIIAAGLLMMILGVFLFIPALVSLVGRLANTLPLPGRQAARDASRHGRRTAAAIGAAIIALALPIALSSHLLSEESFERQTPLLGDNQLLVGTTGSARSAASEALARALDQALPSSTTAPFAKATLDRTDRPAGETVWANGLTHEDEPTMTRSSEVFVGDEDLLTAVGATRGGEVLSQGKAVVLQGYEPVGGVVDVDVPTEGKDGARLQAVAVSSPKVANESFPLIVISPATAETLGLKEITSEYIVAAPGAFSADDVARAKEVAERHPGFYVTSADDYLPPYALLRTFSAAASVAVALGLLAVVVGLVVAESRRSHQILVAIGSGPGMHKKIVASTAGLLALIASALAIPAGLFPTWVVQNGSGAGRPLAIPWATIAVVLVVTPLLASGCAAVLARTPRLGSLLRLSD